MSDIIPAANGGDPDPVTALLMRAATDPGFDSAKFETAVSFLREREATAARRVFNQAVSAAQSRMDAAFKDGKNSHLNNKYATLDALLKVILPAVTAEGLSLRFGSQTASQPGWQCVTCILSKGDHEDVTSLEGPVGGQGSGGPRVQMTPIQITGSTTTYLKRYLLGMVFPMILSDDPQDDDGEASRRGPRGPMLASRPPAVERGGPPQRETAAQWLDRTALDFAAADTSALPAMLAAPRIAQMQGWLTNGALDRLNHILDQAHQRIAKQDDADEAEVPPEEGDGVYAPGEDPFVRQAP
jgi:hypothetical protein